MRFTGQVKIPDLDYPGVPASVQVDDKQVELFVEGESLGRWSLVDVRAERLISSAFSLKLAGEEVTFIADQPTEFAYGGVEAMANVWAKHKTMRLPRRIVANSRSRQGTKPSRIPDLREAIEATLAGTAPTALEAALPPAVGQPSGIASLREATGRPKTDVETSAPADDPAPQEDRGVETGPMPGPDEAEPITSRAAEEVPAAAARAGSEDAPDQHDPVPDSPDTPDAVLAEPETEQDVQPPATDSVFKQSVPWAKKEESEPEDTADPVDAPAPVQAVPSQPTPQASEPPVVESPEPDDKPAVPDDAGTAPEPAVAQPGSVPWLAPPPDDAPAEPAATSPAPPREETDVVEPESDPEHVVDLGEFEDDDHGDDHRGDRDRLDHARSDADDDIATSEVDDEELAPQSMATATARGGIMGAVRSAFVRNRVEHTHVYVEAPGGLGIKRQICADCGHISIGVE